jgi:hypothetical protein
VPGAPLILHPVGGVAPVLMLQSNVLDALFQVKLEQALPLTVMFIDAACDGDDAGMARRTTVKATAASVHAAARMSDWFIFDSQAKGRYGRPTRIARNFRAKQIAIKTM